jgi:hypothetical protein
MNARYALLCKRAHRKVIKPTGWLNWHSMKLLEQSWGDLRRFTDSIVTPGQRKTKRRLGEGGKGKSLGASESAKSSKQIRRNDCASDATTYRLKNGTLAWLMLSESGSIQPPLSTNNSSRHRGARSMKL